MLSPESTNLGYTVEIRSIEAWRLEAPRGDFEAEEVFQSRMDASEGKFVVMMRMADGVKGEGVSIRSPLLDPEQVPTAAGAILQEAAKQIVRRASGETLNSEKEEGQE